MSLLKPVSVVVVLLAASAALGDLTPLGLQPIGAPRFTNSISQSAFATGGARYVGVHVMTASDYIQGVDKSLVPTSAAYTGEKLTDGWWVLGQSGAFTATFETKKGGEQANDYDGLKIQIATADANFNLLSSLTLCYTGGQSPGPNWSKWGTGWYVSTENRDYKGTKLYGATMSVVPAPGAVALAALGLGLCGFRRVREERCN